MAEQIEGQDEEEWEEDDEEEADRGLHQFSLNGRRLASMEAYAGKLGVPGHWLCEEDFLSTDGFVLAVAVVGGTVYWEFSEWSSRSYLAPGLVAVCSFMFVAFPSQRLSHIMMWRMLVVAALVAASDHQKPEEQPPVEEVNRAMAAAQAALASAASEKAEVTKLRRPLYYVTARPAISMASSAQLADSDLRRHGATLRNGLVVQRFVGQEKFTEDESLRYDSINVDEQPALAITSSDTSGVSEFMRQVQRSLTTSQRCDTRIRKLQENKTKRQAQWQAYQLKMQSDFIKQKKQFHNDMAKIEQDILALNDQGQSAASHMQALVAGGTAAMEVEGPTAEDMGEWQALIHRAEEVPQGADFLRIAMEGAAQLRRSGPPPPPALAQVQTGLSMMPPRLMESMVGCPPGMPPIAQAPPEQLVPPPQGHLKAQLGQAVPPHPAGDAGTMIGQQAQTGPPPGSGELDPVQIQAYAAADVANARPGPYSRSPTAASPLGEAKTLPAHQMQASGQQDGPQLPTTAPPQREVCQRQFVKNKHIQPVHPAHPGGVDLATKLAAKRAAAPFGGQQQQQNGLPQQPLPSHQVPVPAEDAQAAAPTAGPQLIDDDGEVPSPHFHDMG
ncbi:moaC [Symbiodinium sp. KB8]|nr:moaC [Symbiodinium sp. KB8]